LEIAIAISVIGLISGFFITKTITLNRIARTQTTKNNVETIVIALASFVANNNRLPRPSFDGEGRESGESDMNLSNFVGKIPFYTLGIPAKTALDGDGKPLIYIVEPNLVSTEFQRIYEKNLNDLFCDNFCGSFSPKISIDKVESLSLERNPIAFVIDTFDNPPNLSENINITVSKNTRWISRDALLMQYLKNAPCRRESAGEPADRPAMATADPFDGI
jgi:hypothetical protein